MHTLSIGAYAVPLPPAATPIQNGFLIKARQIQLPLSFRPGAYYRHGWQSWTLAGWVDPARRLPPLKPHLLNAMQTDPLYVNDPRPNGSWVGAVTTSEGQTLLLGALSLETHVALDNGSLLGWSDGDEAEWLVTSGEEVKVFARYAELLGQRFGKGRVQSPPRVWCSWYSLYREINEKRILEALNGLGDLPFDVFQVDDGWQKGIGDWEANEKFPSGMDELARQIHASGRTSGLWLAPLLVVPSSNLYRQHRDWLLHDEKGRLVSAGYNWNEPLYALDTTHPDALEWLANLMKKVRTWGYDYLKLDFLYAGALPGKRYQEMSREAAYRHGLSVLREAMGEAYFLACGAPIIPSIGLCDGLRVGADVAEVWDRRLETKILDNYAVPSARNAIRNTISRLWLSPLVHTDPDVVYFRSYNNGLTAAQKRLLQDLALITNFKATSDLPAWLTPEERTDLSAFLEAKPKVERLTGARFRVNGREVDFGPALELLEPKSPLEHLFSALLGPLTSLPIVLQINDWLGKRALDRALKKMEEAG